MKEIPPDTSLEQQKLGKKERKRIKFHETSKKQKNLLDFNNGHVKMKKVKKIKIRLADPDIPDSYICEVFDSSLEREEEEEVQLREESSSEFRGRDKSKQRNFFDVLMSKDLRRNFTINSAAQNEEIPEETKLCREVESEAVVQRRKSMKAKNKGKLIELVKRKNNKIKSYCNNTSDDDDDDDESLFHIQSSLQIFPANSEEGFPSNSNAKAKNKENTSLEVSSMSKSSDSLSIPKHKGSNILNYFSKTTTRTLKATVKSRKGSGRLKSRKLTEINMFENNKKECLAKGESDTRVMKPGNVKLAPLFEKKVKTVVDPMVQKARMDFLRNGLPTNIRKISNNLKNVENKFEEVYFPDVSHVQQKDDDPLWHPEDVFIPLMKTEDDSVYRSGGKTFRFRIKNEGVSRTASASLDEQKNQSILTSLQLKYKDLNIDSIFNGFKKKRDNFMRKMKCDNGNDFIDAVNNCEEGNGCYSLWTDVYRPRSDEIMGNKLTVARLSGWFKSWKEYSNEVKKSSSKEKTETLSSLDDSDIFVSSDNDRTGLQSPVNMCLLSGPIASGKTSLVYALATEFDFNVLEVNASSTRTGKKLLLNVEEATKSHQVRNGLNTATTGEKEKDQEMKMRMKTKKKKRKFSDDTKKSNCSQMSLILIEDADIIFEERDEGFVAAISTLVQSSKRPFIFLSNDPNCGYLERLKQQQVLLLEMRRPSFQNARAVLDVIASVEGVRLDRETLDNVIQGNNYDLRKSILELQFWVQSGKGLIRNVGNASELGKLWWGLNKFLYKKKSLHVAKIDYRKRKRSSDFFDSSEDETEEGLKKAKLNAGLARASKIASAERKSDSSIHSYARILDFMLVSDLFKYGSDLEPIPMNEYRPYDGLSLSECMESVDYNVKDFSCSIIEELVTTSARVFASCDVRDASCVLSNPPASEIRWRNMHHDAKQDLVSLLPSHGSFSKRNIHLDYLPIMRNMCRAEKSRYIGNTKRKNRFYHYFRTLGCNPRDESLEISCDILSI